MWRISRTSGTMQEILIMAAMNLLHTGRGEQYAMSSHLSGEVITSATGWKTPSLPQ
jgi:hypothetical protein